MVTDPHHEPDGVEELAFREQEKLDRLMEMAGVGVTRAEALAFLRRSEAAAESGVPVCALADGGCQGRLEWHHAIKQQRLKRRFPYGAWLDPRTGRFHAAHRTEPVTKPQVFGRTLDRILGDTRNRVFLCHHHHELVTNGRLRVEPPESVWEFARDFGLVGMLENDLRRAA